MKYAAFSGLAALAAAAGIALGASSASAIKCPPPTHPGTVSVPVTGTQVQSCTGPIVQCDPRPCDPTAAPPQE